MLEVAEIIRRHGAAYRAQYQLLPSQARALRDIEACRTAYFGGHLKQCDHCGGQVYAYHSCRNRHCPKCHGDQTERWLAQQQPHLLPCPYFLVTFTLPAELRPLAFAQQKIVYSLMLRCAAPAPPCRNWHAIRNTSVGDWEPWPSCTPGPETCAITLMSISWSLAAPSPLRGKPGGPPTIPPS